MQSDETPNLEKQQEHIEQLRAKVNAAKIAFLNGTPFAGKERLSYEDLKKVAQEFIKATYDFQKQKYGAVKVKISVAKLLRR
jgi:isocitrate lyase